MEYVKGIIMDIITGFKIRDEKLISFVGSGGKTTTMFRLAKELVKKGRRVITTTTTKIYRPANTKKHSLILLRSPEDIKKISMEFMKVPHITIGHSIIQKKNQEKLIGIEEKLIHKIHQEFDTITILVEADGAKGRPLKAPAKWEPVVPNKSQIVFIVIGLSGIKRPLNESTVFRSHIFSHVTKTPLHFPIELDTIERIVAHHRGLLKGLPTKSIKLLFLNQADRLKKDYSEILYWANKFYRDNHFFDIIAIGASNYDIPVWDTIGQHVFI